MNKNAMENRTDKRTETKKRRAGRKRKAAAVLAFGAFTCMIGVNGIMAYFTDNESVTNTFTVGKISLELDEPQWDPPENIVPGQPIKKDPQITNNGLNDEFVFMEVIVPYKKVITAAEDGTKSAAAEKELFTYTVNQGWTEMGTGTKNPEDGTILHRYVFGSATVCTALAKNQKTPALFDSVRLINVVEGQGLEESTQHIVVNAYGIQTTDIDGGKTSPAEVWSVLSGQLTGTV